MPASQQHLSHPVVSDNSALLQQQQEQQQKLYQLHQQQQQLYLHYQQQMMKDPQLLMTYLQQAPSQPQQPLVIKIVFVILRFLGHLKDDLINPVKVSVRTSVRPQSNLMQPQTK